MVYLTTLSAAKTSLYESLISEREQVRKIPNISFHHLGILGILLLQKNTKMAKTHIVNFSYFVPFLQLAIHISSDDRMKINDELECI
jgi:hypothetical protein